MLLAAAPQPTPTTAEVVLHLTFDDGSGTNAFDSSGTGNDGALMGMDPNTAWVTGNCGLGLDFDGVDDHVQVPDHAAYDFGSDPFSVTAWVNLRPATFNFAVGIMEDGGVTAAGTEWGLTPDIGPVTGSSFSVTYSVGLAGATTSGDLTTGVWHHLAGVRDGTELRLYIDGVLADSTTYPGGAINDTGLDLQIGWSPGSSVEVWFDGQIDDVQLYSGALTASDVAFLYANCGQVVSPSPLPAPGLPLGPRIALAMFLLAFALLLVGRQRA